MGLWGRGTEGRRSGEKGIGRRAVHPASGRPRAMGREHGWHAHGTLRYHRPQEASAGGQLRLAVQGVAALLRFVVGPKRSRMATLKLGA